MTFNKSYAFCLSILVIALDQLTKYWAMVHLMPYESVSVFPMLSWTLVFNSGSAFSFLADAGAWHTWFFVALILGVSVGLIVWIIRLQQREVGHMVALALILGGALGNLVDRIRIGYVIDFIDVYYKSYHWPVFNLADSAVCIGGGVLAYLWLKPTSLR